MSSPDNLAPGPGHEVLDSSQVSYISTDLEKNNNGDTDEEKGTIAPELKEDTAPNADDEEGEYPKGIKLTVIIIALCLSIFLMALDFVSPPPLCRSALKTVHVQR